VAAAALVSVAAARLAISILLISRLLRAAGYVCPSAPARWEAPVSGSCRVR
jgi:hypothetical protein